MVMEIGTRAAMILEIFLAKAIFIQLSGKLLKLNYLYTDCRSLVWHKLESRCLILYY